ncbi:MAG: hypothetical protein ACREER_07255, partial [Alphaproteobacteria bacterium]
VLGFSLQKIAVLIGILAALWTVFRVVRGVGRLRAKVAASRNGARTVANDMKECPVCSTYVAPAMARDCGRARCPYPRTTAGTASRA